jgi:hypothetical protein
MAGVKFQFANDIVIAYQSKNLNDGVSLTNDLEVMNIYFRKWRLKLNPAKTEICAFHLNNKQVKDKLEVKFDKIRAIHNICPKYLGITLNRALTFKAHLSTLNKKIRFRSNLVQMLASTGWGVDTKTLRILGLVYSTAEFVF